LVNVSLQRTLAAFDSDFAVAITVSTPFGRVIGFLAILDIIVLYMLYQRMLCIRILSTELPRRYRRHVLSSLSSHLCWWRQSQYQGRYGCAAALPCLCIDADRACLHE